MKDNLQVGNGSSKSRSQQVSVKPLVKKVLDVNGCVYTSISAVTVMFLEGQ